MIFVTTGTQEPFDRLLRVVDVIALKIPDIKIVAQTSKSQYKVANIYLHDFLSPVEFNTLFDKAQLIVAHAGMGTIISALVHNKPILVLPRLAKYGEHRNDHQLATAKAFEKLQYLHVAYSEEELESKILPLIKGHMSCNHKIGKYASQQLIASLKNFITA
ncbi:glycosyltransferase [Pontibacter amylolyticus]|uniref:Glucosyl transferase n=1 Tax=Pontibacter amylolyticus TaxID=1424080 RepID=A0ABQ1WEG1_9BACT|nr:glycosyltransferase [Pontibacter amylolyticus]GGG28289.1 glucosyl transferase [Pontibacter amylolyticus]